MKEIIEEVLITLLLFLFVAAIISIPIVVIQTKMEKIDKKKEDCIKNGGMWAETYYKDEQYCIYDYSKENK